MRKRKSDSGYSGGGRRPTNFATIRLSNEDEKIVAALIRKKGGNFPSVTREAWRLLAAKEELNFAS